MALKTTIAKRVVFGLGMIFVLAGLLVGEGWVSERFFPERFEGLLFAVMVTVVSFGGAAELARLIRNRGVDLSLWIIFPGLALVILYRFWSVQGFQGVSLAGAIMSVLLAGGIHQAVKKGVKDTILNLGGICFSLIYLGLGCFFIVEIRLLGRGSVGVASQIGAVVMFLACVKSADIGAYFTGRFLGRHKWVPSISPAKTWEGLLGGLVLAVIVASIFADIFDIMASSRAILFGIVIGVAGQLGDLLESMLKRDASVKDSAKLIPAFGGFLDLTDSPMVAAPIGYLLLVI